MLTNKADKKVDFKNVSFKSKMNFESIMKLKKKIKRLILQNLSALAQVRNTTINLPSF